MNGHLRPSLARLTVAWHQVLVEFADPAGAERYAARELAPLLDGAVDAGMLHGWWFIRKTPAWRFRYAPASRAETVVGDLVSRLEGDDEIAHWAAAVYEPETVAFGGPEAMGVAHELFYRDSRCLLADVARARGVSGVGRCEVAVVLCSAMLRGAGLDWYEQGDVWAKVARLRPGAHRLSPGRSHTLAEATRTLLTADPRAVGSRLPEPWLAPFEDAGRALAALVRSGGLGRGLRSVLAHHVIFHANRAGLPAADQATLAALAVDAVFHPTVPVRTLTPHRGSPT